MTGRTNPWIIGSAAVVGGCLSAAAYGTTACSSQLFGPSVYRGRGRRRSIALTFDDGPSDGSLQLLEYLDKENISATFFECGMNVQRHPAIARAIQRAGHEIGNHTYSHARLCPRLGRHPRWMSPAEIYEEFRQAQDLIQNEVGVAPALLRAPYGLRWYGIGAAQKRLNLLGVMWTVIGHDWEWPAARVAELVLRKASPGGIVCLHDGRDVQPNPDVSRMMSAVRKIVPVLKDQGYSFETVTSLLQPDAA